MALLAATLGIAGGGAAWVLIHLIGLITNVVLFHQWGWTLPSFADFHPGPILIVEAAAGGSRLHCSPGGRRLFAATASPKRWKRCSHARAESRRTRRSPSRPRRRSRSGRAVRSGPKDRSSSPGAHSARWSGSCIRVTPSERKILLACGSGRGDVSDVRGSRSQLSCWRSSCCCSSSRTVRSSRSSSRRASPAACTPRCSARDRSSTSRPTTTQD